MNKNAPIGIWDSGLGGLTVVKAIEELMPNEELIYFADSAHAPYGNKSDEQILTRAIFITEFLISKNVKAIVIACNTATAATVEHLRKHYQLPIIAIEPGIKPALEKSKNDVIAVLATQSTLNSQRYRSLLNTHKKHHQIIETACNGWVEMIEKGEIDKSLIKHHLTQAKHIGADTLVLGCTHYPIISKHIINELPNVQLIDTGKAVAIRLSSQINKTNSAQQKPLIIYATANVKSAIAIIYHSEYRFELIG